MKKILLLPLFIFCLSSCFQHDIPEIVINHDKYIAPIETIYTTDTCYIYIYGHSGGKGE